jgi:hypothetical protein
MNSVDLNVGDHVTLNGLDVLVITARRMTPETASGVSFRLLPGLPGEWIDAGKVRAVTGYSHREAERDLGEDEDDFEDFEP